MTKIQIDDKLYTMNKAKKISYKQKKEIQLLSYKKLTKEISEDKINNRKNRAEEIVSFLMEQNLLHKTKNERILDAGCGFGFLTTELTKSGFNSLGIDFSPELVFSAKKIAEKQKLETKFVVADLTEKLPFKESFFDAIFLMDVLHHFWKFETILEQTIKTLKKGGSIFIIEANTTNPLRLLSAIIILFSISFLPKKFHLAPHTSEFFHLIRSYRKVLTRNGLSKINVVPLFLKEDSQFKNGKFTDFLYKINIFLFKNWIPLFCSREVIIRGIKD